MPRLKNRAPKYALHKASGQAIVRINGRIRYLGPYDSKASRIEYDRLVEEWRSDDGTQARGDMTISHLCLGYWRHTQSYYVRDGQPTSEQAGVKSAIKRFRKRYGKLRVVEFRPKHLRALMTSMANERLSRNYVNQTLARLKMLFAWGTEREMVPGSVYHALLAVKGLRIGRSKAVDNPPRRPVDDATIAATVAKMPRMAGDVVQVLRLSGCRPSELFAMRRGDIDRTVNPWVYRPRHHKTEHHGHLCIRHFGPKAQAIILPYLVGPADGLVFERPKGGPFKRWNLNQTVRRAAKRAGVEPWTPYQLRHSHGTEARARFGLDGAQAALGHAKATITEVYAEVSSTRAADVARAIG